MAMAIFISRPNSHPFEERRLVLTEPVKIGRSVAKSRPAANNCIFDCKVLSRNHAMLWYEAGKFFLQDTKSSNGTFINNVRLSKGSEESEPKELCSSDIVQFGVDVVENSKKVTHGCIIATVTLYSPDGKEITRSGGINRSVFSMNESNVRAQEVWQLSQYLQDAIHREQLLETKLATLQRLIKGSQAVAEETKQSIIHEDKLLSRLETLENQLEIVTKNSDEESSKKELHSLHEEKHNYEMRAKESLKKVLQEKLETLQKLAEVERSCSSAEEECAHFKSLYDRSQEELQDLAEKHSQRLKEMQSLQDQMDEAAQRHEAVEEQMEREKKDLNLQLQEMYAREKSLSAKMESLEAESDFAKQQLTSMRAKMEKTKEQLELVSDSRTNNSWDKTGQGDSVAEVNGPREFIINEISVLTGSSPDSDESRGSFSVDDPKSLREKLKRLEAECLQKENLCSNLEGKLSETRSELLESQRKLSDLKGDSSTSQINGQLEKDNIEFWKDELVRSQLELQQEKDKVKKLEEEVMVYHLQTVDELSEGLDDLDSLDVESEESVSTDQNEDQQAKNLIGSQYNAKDTSPDKLVKYTAQLRLLKERIQEVKILVKERHDSMIKWLGEDGCAQNKGVVNSLEVTAVDLDQIESANENHETNVDPRRILQDSLGSVEEIKAQLTNGKERVAELKEELNNVQAYAKEFRQQIVDLRDKLLEEQESTRRQDEYVAQLRRELQELTRERDLMRVEKKFEHETVESARSAAREMQKQAALSAEKAGKNKVELSAVTDDNQMLKQKIQTLESELKRYRRENNRMSSDNSRLQASYKELETQTRQRQDSLLRKQNNLRSKGEKETNGNSLDQTSAFQDNISRLEKQLKDQKEKAEKDLRLEKDRSATAISYLLLVAVIVFAVLLAFATDIVSIRPGNRSVLEVITWLWKR